MSVLSFMVKAPGNPGNGHMDGAADLIECADVRERLKVQRVAPVKSEIARFAALIESIGLQKIE